jgi:cytochrome c-type biogenesis protein CcmE
MKPRQKKFAFIIAGLVAVAGAVGLVMYSLKNNVSLYFTPTQVYNKEAPQGRNFRIGGLVEQGSVKRQKDGLTVHFSVTDNVRSMPVVYKGILPDLFKEGKGVVVQGKLESNIFQADEVLAKHDENYMPPEAADALAKAAKGQSATAPSAVATPAALQPNIK